MSTYQFFTVNVPEGLGSAMRGVAKAASAELAGATRVERWHVYEVPAGNASVFEQAVRGLVGASGYNQYNRMQPTFELLSFFKPR